MAGTALADRSEPRDEETGQSVDTLAGAALSQWLNEHPAVARELDEAAQARIHLQELDARSQAADTVADEADRKAASAALKLDPAGHRLLHPAAGGALVAGLLILDVWPLNWAAQAFGFDSAGSWLVTGILLAASISAMAALEMGRGHRRRSALIAAGLSVACLTLVVLRTQFLMVVNGEGLTGALLQSVMLTAISLCLILCGSMILGRTRVLRLARARAAAHRARREANALRSTRVAAAERMQRHFGALRQRLIPWALSSPAPAGIDHVSWAAALERAVRGLFAGF
jgi:hypothetical protein